MEMSKRLNKIGELLKLEIGKEVSWRYTDREVEFIFISEDKVEIVTVKREAIYNVTELIVAVKSMFKDEYYENYVAVRERSEAEIKVFKLLERNIIEDDDFYLDYAEGTINVIDIEEEESYTIEMDFVDEVNIINEGDLFNNMEMELIYYGQGLKYIIKEVEGMAECKIIDLDEEVKCEDCAKLEAELEAVRRENKELKELDGIDEYSGLSYKESILSLRSIIVKQLLEIDNLKERLKELERMGVKNDM